MAIGSSISTTIERTYGITYHHTLADLIQLNTGPTVQPNVFKATG